MTKTLLALLLLPLPALADGGIVLTDAWSRETKVPNQAAVAYLTITDSGAADTLTSVATPIAEHATVHQSTESAGMMHMEPVASLQIAAGARQDLKPGGYHIMLTGLKQPLKAGDSFPITLTFAHAGAITATVAVRPLAATTPPASDDMNQMGMGQH